MKPHIVSSLAVPNVTCECEGSSSNIAHRCEASPVLTGGTQSGRGAWYWWPVQLSTASGSWLGANTRPASTWSWSVAISTLETSNLAAVHGVGLVAGHEAGPGAGEGGGPGRAAQRQQLQQEPAAGHRVARLRVCGERGGNFNKETK